LEWKPANDILRRIVSDVRRQAGGGPQSDGVAVLAIRYHGQR
jgi:hypothetical protein